ncbi:MAG: ABC transporter permease [Rhizobacter sp.]|nr:ABC transporter permease [Chlorobiales bacterium]
MNITYILSESFSGFRRAKLSSAISVFTVAVSLVLLAVFALITLNAVKVLNELRSRIEVEVFLSDRLAAADGKRLAEDFKKQAAVREAVYVSKEEAAAIFDRDYNAGGQGIVKVLGTNPLPQSVKVNLKTEHATLDSLKKFAAAVSKVEGVTDTKFNQEMLKGIDSNARLLSYITAGVGLIISLASVALVSNTIRLAIYAKREIIRTMKLVGATYGFIRSPFLIEGFLQGLIGGVVATGIIYVIVEIVVRNTYPSIYQVLVPPSLAMYAAVVIAGCVLGFTGSFFSVRKFINET